VPIHASIAVLATDCDLAEVVAQQISQYQSFIAHNHVSNNEADPAITFGSISTLVAIAAEPEMFDPPQLGSYLAWGSDIALLVVNSSIGLDGAIIKYAQEVSQLHPLLVAVTGLDSPRSNFDETLAVISRVMDQHHHAVAITLPVLSESGSLDESDVGGILDLLDLEIRVPDQEGESISHELEQAHYDLIESHLEALTNAVVVTSTDESLIHSILEHGFESPDQLREQLLNATARREIIPVFAIADSIGIREVAQFAGELICEPWTPTPVRGEVFLASALGSGRIRIWQGKLTSGTYFADNVRTEITEIRTISGTKKAASFAGEIVEISADPAAPAGSTISSEKSNPLTINHVFE
jgi:hypothetical protein